ncbi:MAG: HEAT repeat domain-containing protein [Candidatus Riflebacteria bacterium]|nr:HEAT repeat domain-containing protein [Candidatus Riflebacteria bacterium]
MRIVDEIIFQYPEQSQEARRWSLTVLEDAAPDADVFPRVTFLGDRTVKDTGLTRHQALTSFAALLPLRRLAGWAKEVAPLAPVPILDLKKTPLRLDAPALQQLAWTLGAADGDVPHLEELASTAPDPFPLALGLSLRRRCRRNMVDLVERRAAALPELGLLCATLFGKSTSRVIQRLARDASPELRISFLRALTRHPERSWPRSFRSLIDARDVWVKVHALAMLGRLATPQAAALLVELARRTDVVWARVQAVRSAVRIGGSQATETALEHLHVPHDEVRGATLDALLSGGILDERLDRAADRLRGSENPRVRCLSLAVLARAGVGARWRELVEGVGSMDPRVRIATAVALGRLSDGRSQQVLERVAVKDPSRTVASTAIRSLVGSRGSLTVKTFREVLARGGMVARAAAEVLVWRASDTPGEVFEILGRQPTPGPGLLALGVASAATGAREGISILASTLVSKDPNELGWAVEALYPLGSAVPRRLLMPCLKTRVAALQARAAVALTLCGDNLGPEVLRSLCEHPEFSSQGARGLLDLAAILPTVFGRPLFGDVAALAMRLQPLPAVAEGAPTTPDLSTSELALPIWPDLEKKLKDAHRFDLALSGEWIPEVAFAAHDGEPGPGESCTEFDPKSVLEPTDPDTAGSEASVVADAAPSVCPVCGHELGGELEGGPAVVAAASPVAQPVLAVAEAPPIGPGGPAARGGVPGPWLAGVGVRRNVAAAAVASSLVVGVALMVWISRQPVPTLSPGPVASVAPLPALGFVPFAAVGTRLARGSTPARELGLSDALIAGDVVVTSATGSMALRSSRGSRLSLAESSAVRLRGEAPCPSGKQYVFDRLRGRVRIDWREQHRVRLELNGGAVEADGATLIVDRTSLQVRTGEARWIPAGGVEQIMRGGSSLDLSRPN